MVKAIKAMIHNIKGPKCNKTAGFGAVGYFESNLGRKKILQRNGGKQWAERGSLNECRVI